MAKEHGELTENTLSQMPTRQDFERVVRAANLGDPIALSQLRHVLRENPVIWQKIGDLGLVAENALVELISSGNQLVRESIIRKIDELKRELTPTSPTTLDKLAVQRVVTCWLESEYLTAIYPEPVGASLGQQQFCLRLRDSANRRYDLAMKSLLLIQKLLPGGIAYKPQTVQPRRAGRPPKNRPTRSSANDACTA